MYWSGNADTGHTPQTIPPHDRATASPDTLAAVAGGNRFAFDLFGELRNSRGEGNMLLSPLSISTALAMTYAGARGQTAEQMAAALHFDLPPEQLHPAMGALVRDLNAPRAGYQLSVSNRLFGQEGIRFRPEFLETNASDYGAPLDRLDFAGSPEPSRLYINDWVAEQTNDRILNLLPGGAITPSTQLVLTNTVYFDGQWKYQFDKDATREQAFHLSTTEQVVAPLMFQRETLRYGDFGDYRMVELPYAGDDLSMVVVLPNDVDGLADLEMSLTAEQFGEDVDALARREVLVYLPKFTFEDSFKRKDPLQNLGMPEAFSDSANFTGMADLGLKISDVFHKTFTDLR